MPVANSDDFYARAPLHCAKGRGSSLRFGMTEGNSLRAPFVLRTFSPTSGGKRQALNVCRGWEKLWIPASAGMTNCSPWASRGDVGGSASPAHIATLVRAPLR